MSGYQMLMDRDKLEVLEPFLRKVFELAVDSELTVEEIRLAFELGNRVVDKSPIIPGEIFLTKRTGEEVYKAYVK